MTMIGDVVAKMFKALIKDAGTATPADIGGDDVERIRLELNRIQGIVPPGVVIKKGPDIPSASEITLGGKSNYFHITGTTTITSLSMRPTGEMVWFAFDGALILTHNASTLILPTAANITTVAGDVACFVFEGADVIRCIYYQRASGSSLSGATVLQTVSTQVGAVSTTTVTIPMDDTIPQNTEGAEVMTLAITPKSDSSTLYIEVSVTASSSAAGNDLIVALFRDTTANALAAVVSNLPSATGSSTLRLRFSVAASSLSATTFKVRAGCNGVGTTTINGTSGARKFGGVMATSIIISERIS